MIAGNLRYFIEKKTQVGLCHVESLLRYPPVPPDRFISFVTPKLKLKYLKKKSLCFLIFFKFVLAEPLYKICKNKYDKCLNIKNNCITLPFSLFHDFFRLSQINTKD